MRREEAQNLVAEKRDKLGRRVREVWIQWARRQPSPKASWLIPYDELSEPDKEADRCIGAAIWGDAVEEFAEFVGAGVLNAALRDPVKEVPLPDSEGWWWEWDESSKSSIMQYVWFNMGLKEFVVTHCGQHIPCKPGRWVKASPPPEASEPTAAEQPICICCHGAKFVDPGDVGSLAIPCGRCNGTGLEPRRYVMQPTAIDSATAELRAENERQHKQLAEIRNAMCMPGAVHEALLFRLRQLVDAPKLFMCSSCESMYDPKNDCRVCEANNSTRKAEREIERLQSQLAAKGKEVERKLLEWMKAEAPTTIAAIAAEARRIVEGGK